MKSLNAFALSVLVATIGIATAREATAEIKPVSTASCQRYFKSAVIDLGNLQFLAEGIRNVSATPQYIICPLPKSAKKWDASFSRTIGFYFHRDDASAPSAQLAACSLNSGSEMDHGMVTKFVSGKLSMSGEYAEVLFNKTTGPHVSEWGAVTAICVIPPKYTLDYIHFQEG